MADNLQVTNDPGYALSNDIHHSQVIRFFAWLVSYVFHPLFITIYATYYLVFVHPIYFAGINNYDKVWILLRILVNMVFFPLISVLLLKGVGFIDSIFLKTQKERIIPYIISNIFFFWMYLVFRNQPEISSILTSFVFSVFISTSLALIANIYFKISIHAIAVGGLLGLMLVILVTKSSSPITLPFVAALLIAGVVCTARMIVGKHTQKDIYIGLFCGVISQITGAWFIL